MKALKILEALSIGMEVELERRQCVLAQAEASVEVGGKCTVLACTATVFSGSELQEGETLLALDYTLGQFIDICESIPEEKYQIVLANIALNLS